MNPQDSGPVLEPACPHCGAAEVVRAGRRVLKDSVRQMWRCKACDRRFSHLRRSGKRTDGRVILQGLRLYCEGYSLEETAFILEKKYGLARSKSCLSKWLADFDPPYRAIRKLNHDCHPVVRSHLLTHRGLNYEYQLHLPKLRFAKPYPGLVEFLKRLPEGIPAEVFEGGVRCSELPPEGRTAKLGHGRRTNLCDVALEALRLARHARERHAVVEGYFLSCDRNTIAAEVPVWYYDKRMAATVAGHIDLVQVNRGQLWLLDYKPNAARENPGKVMRQLGAYARALGYRAGIPPEQIRCGWFDEEDFFGFGG